MINSGKWGLSLCDENRCSPHGTRTSDCRPVPQVFSITGARPPLFRKMTERKFTRGLNKPGMAAQLRETVSQVVRESTVLVSTRDAVSVTKTCFLFQLQGLRRETGRRPAPGRPHTTCGIASARRSSRGRTRPTTGYDSTRHNQLSLCRSAICILRAPFPLGLLPTESPTDDNA